MAATLAGTPSLFRLKSMMRYCCLWPPPRWRAVLRPYALRPPVLGFGASRLFSGLVLVISEKSETVWNRRPGLVGLRLRRGISGLRMDRAGQNPAGKRKRRRCAGSASRPERDRARRNGARERSERYV